MFFSTVGRTKSEIANVLNLSYGTVWEGPGVLIVLGQCDPYLSSFGGHDTRSVLTRFAHAHWGM